MLGGHHYNNMLLDYQINETSTGMRFQLTAHYHFPVVTVEIVLLYQFAMRDRFVSRSHKKIGDVPRLGGHRSALIACQQRFGGRQKFGS